MTSDSEFTRFVRSWLQDHDDVLPDHVLQDVLNRVPTTVQSQPLWRTWGRRLMEGTFRFAVAGAAVLAIALIGYGLYASNLGPAATPTAIPTALPSPSSGAPTGVVRGWPGATRNPAGVYSWDGSPDRPGAIEGFMHNAWLAPGDVEIRIEAVPGAPITDDGATAVTVAGHDGLYRRIDALREEWIVDIEGTTIAIRVDTLPRTNPTNLAEAHAIIESMRTEPQDNDLGFRLVFTLTTDNWDSG